MLEPRAGGRCDGLERARFLEQMMRAEYKLQEFLAGQRRQRLPVRVDHLVVLAADNQQRLRARPATPLRAARPRRRCWHQTGRAEDGLGIGPVHRMQQAIGQQRNVESISPVPRFLLTPRIEQ
jgi:hypothetical protein